MLGVKNYSREYIDGCRSRIDADVAAFRAVTGASEEFEHRFFNNLVIVLDAMFVHRLRSVEGKNGNPLNEVRMLNNSMLVNDNIFTADNTIKLKPDNTILRLQFGDAIGLDIAAFVALADAFFAELERLFGSS